MYMYCDYDCCDYDFSSRVANRVPASRCDPCDLAPDLLDISAAFVV